MSFLRSLPAYGPARDAYILGAIQIGNLDEPEWVDVQCGPVTLQVSSDYLKIQGERPPMAAYVAQAAVDALGALLPTPKIVEAIEAAARERGRLIPFVPWPHWQDNSQLETSTILWREGNIPAVPPGTLVAGCLKDVVIAPRLAWMLDRVLIFGGLYSTWKRVQDLQTNKTAHHAGFDNGYAGGIRAVLDACLVNGVPARVSEILRDPARASWLSSEGALTIVRYPLAPVAAHAHSGGATEQPTNGGHHEEVAPVPVTITPASSSTPRLLRASPGTTGGASRFLLPEGTALRRGHSGPLVAELQRLLARAGFSVARDSLFGNATESAVIELQSERGLEVDGVVGPQTRKALGWVLPEEEDTEPGDLPDVPSILSDAEVDALFGPLLWVPAPTATEPRSVRVTNGWTKDNLRRVVIPQLRGVQGAPQDGGIYLHRLIVEQTRALFAAWEAAGLRGLLLSWAGSWNPRLVRGGSTLSRHSYATSFDVNAAWNPMGKPAAPKGAKGSVIELIPLAVEHGYTNGMNWSRPDAMHFECFRVL